MPAYWIAHVEVTDAERYGAYAKLAGPAIAAHGGKFLARGGSTSSSRATTARATCSWSSPTSRPPRPATARPRTRRRSATPRAPPMRDLVIVEGP